MLPDLVIVAAVAAFAVWGWWRGLLREIFGIAGLVLGVLAAWRLAPPLAGIIKLSPRFMPWISILTAVVLFILVVILANFAGRIARRMFVRGPLKPLDRFGGFVFGSVKGALLVVLAAAVALLTPMKATLTDSSRRARLLPWALRLAQPLSNWARDGISGAVASALINTLPSIPAVGKEGSAASGLSPVDSVDLASLPSVIFLHLEGLSSETRGILDGWLESIPAGDYGLDVNFSDLLKAGIKTIEVATSDLNLEVRRRLAEYRKLRSPVPHADDDVMEISASELDSLIRALSARDSTAGL